MDYISLLGLGIGLLRTYLDGMKNKLPAQIVAGLQASIDALEAHRQDELTKANFEAQRG